ncbi:hypothetical protein T06_3630 [Trichinella sp. T6]|nr:hypothetical protein T06_3630 [Trichinella sp. T6]
MGVAIKNLSKQVHFPHILSFPLPLVGGGLEGREGFYKCKRAMAVNRGFVQLISLTVYC